MKTTYLGLATVAMILLASTSFVRADAPGGYLGGWNSALEGTVMERAQPLGDLADDPLGLLWDEDGIPFDEEIIIKDGLVIT